MGASYASSLVASTSRSHCYRQVGNCYRAIGLESVNASIHTSNLVTFRAIPSVALSNGIAIGDIYITILTDYEEPDLNRLTTGKIAGFDFGLKRFLTGSNGHDIESPQRANAASTLSNVPMARQYQTQRFKEPGTYTT